MVGRDGLMVKIIWLWFSNHLPHHKHCKGPQERAKSNSGQVLRQWGSLFHSLCWTSISAGIIPKLWKNTPHLSLSTHSSSNLNTENTDVVKAYLIDTIHRHLKPTDDYRSMQVAIWWRLLLIQLSCLSCSATCCITDLLCSSLQGGVAPQARS